MRPDLVKKQRARVRVGVVVNTYVRMELASEREPTCFSVVGSGFKVEKCNVATIFIRVSGVFSCLVGGQQPEFSKPEQG